MEEISEEISEFLTILARCIVVDGSNNFRALIKFYTAFNLRS